MKPSPSAPPTEEDLKVWRWVLGKAYERHRIGNLALDCLPQDRRDAELMLQLQKLRATGDCYLRLKIGVHWCNVIVPPVQVYLRNNPVWPNEPRPDITNCA
jgi:hypothetical protein